MATGSSLGRARRRPGQFNTPHSIAVDAKGNVYVADRGNRRIQVFDGDGKFLRQITIDVPFDPKRTAGDRQQAGADRFRERNHAAGSPWAICITPGPNQVLFSSDAYPGRIYKLSLDGKVLGWLGESGKQLKQFGWIHEIACPRKMKFTWRTAELARAETDSAAHEMAKEKLLDYVEILAPRLGVLRVAGVGSSVYRASTNGNPDPCWARCLSRVGPMAEQRIGMRAYMRSTYDRSGGNEGADASHFLYQLADDFNVTLDVEGPGILLFSRYNHWHGSPWHYVVDGTDHIVQETSTADPLHPGQDSTFLPRAPLPSPLDGPGPRPREPI